MSIYGCRFITGKDEKGFYEIDDKDAARRMQLLKYSGLAKCKRRFVLWYRRKEYRSLNQTLKQIWLWDNERTEMEGEKESWDVDVWNRKYKLIVEKQIR
jgi:hypothetical protein